MSDPDGVAWLDAMSEQEKHAFVHDLIAAASEQELEMIADECCTPEAYVEPTDITPADVRHARARDNSYGNHRTGCR